MYLLLYEQVVFIDHAKATKLLPDILEQNSIPAVHSKGLLEKYVPAEEPMMLDRVASDTGSDVNDAVEA